MLLSYDLATLGKCTFVDWGNAHDPQFYLHQLQHAHAYPVHAWFVKTYVSIACAFAVTVRRLKVTHVAAWT